MMPPIPAACVSIFVLFASFSVLAAAAVGGPQHYVLSSEQQPTRQHPIVFEQQQQQNRRAMRRLSPQADQAVREWRSKVFDADGMSPPMMHVDYGGNHPFEIYQKSNDQQKKEGHRDRDLAKSPSKHRRLRIHFETSPLEALKGQYGELIDAKIDFIINEILPVAGKTWSDALSVVPVNARIGIPQGACWGAVTKSFTVKNADVVVIVHSDVQLCREASGAIASAFPCIVDQWDRPIVGVANFCLNPSDGGDFGGIGGIGSERARLVETSLHELGHLLGFVDELMKFYRDGETGEPLTPRPFRYETVTCVDGRDRRVIKPPFIRDGMTASGARYFEVTTPRVAQVVRNQFDCQRLNGARLETQPTSQSCYGSHLDERLFFTELMGAIYTDSMVLSALTLAFLEDSGWYKANYTNAATSPFGHRAGCGFVTGDCIVDGAVPDYGEDFFCNEPLGITSQGIPSVNMRTAMCDPSRRKKAACDLIDRSELASDLLYETSAQLPDEYQYFQDENVGAASMPLADYCPIPAMELQDCRDPSNRGEYEEFGESSFCYTSFFRDQFGRNQPFSPLCLQTRCNAEDRTVEVSKDGKTLSCGEYNHGDMIKLPKTPLRLACPRFDVVCADLVCPANCSGRGLCERGNDGSGSKCICFDESDNSPGCFGSDIVQDDTETRPSPAAASVKETPAPTEEPTQEEFIALDPTHDPTQNPTYGYPASDDGGADEYPARDDGGTDGYLDSGDGGAGRPAQSPPNDSPTPSPVITLYADSFRVSSSAIRCCGPLTVAVLCPLLIILLAAVFAH